MNDAKRQDGTDALGHLLHQSAIMAQAAEDTITGLEARLQAAEAKLEAVREWAEPYSCDFITSRIRREIAIHILAILDKEDT